MSDDTERTCPLCAEEMDLTDQQLKPCKCGYEICVWCWHQINNMAEKEEIEGRCPACRTPYDKERIVQMAANCGRVVAEINAEKKQKSQKTKAKTSVEAKKHLSTVRVVQRNLVYIIGLPAKLCDETILQRKEYFGQYGKVLKVSISRHTGVPSQQTSSNCTVSVYITYAREEEAIRCIQAVHNYALEGKTLRACFGTTKYCHAWLRNMSCSNPDCMYLHDIGSQEDSFTKDEIISAYTWSRVPQIALNNSQWRSGNVLPPPADDFSNNVTTSGKNQVRSVSNIHPNYSLMSSISQIKGSPNSSSPVKPTVLPVSASWGHRNSNGKPPAASAACSQVPCAKRKVEVVGNSCLPHILTESTKHFSAWNDEVITISKVPELHPSTSKSPSLLIEDINESSSWDEIVETPKVPEGRETMQINGTIRPVEPYNLSSETDRLSDCSSKFSSWNKVVTSKDGEENKLGCLDDGSMQSKDPEPVNKQSQRSTSNVSAVAYIPQFSNFLDNLPVNTPENKETFVYVDDDNTVNNTNPKYFDRQLGQFVKVGQSSSTINRDKVEELNVDQLQVLDSISLTAEMPPNHDSDSTSSMKVCTLFDKHSRNELKDQNSELLKEKLNPAENGENGTLLPCDYKMHKVPEIFDQSSSHYLNDSYNGGNFSKCISWDTDVGNKQLSCIDRNFNRKLKINSFVLGDKECTLLDGHKEHEQSSYSPRQFFECPEMNCNEKKDKHLEMVNDLEISDKHATVDMKRESSIISDILSLDVDPWDDSLTTVNDFARLLGETERQERPFKLFSSLKANNTNQSRFSFARQENHVNPVQPIRDETYTHKFCSSSQDSYENGLLNGIMSNSFQTPTAVINGNLVISSDKVADGTSRAKIPAPPGFTAQRRAPPPGFFSQDRLNLTHETPLLENCLLGYPIGNHYQMHPAEHLNDVEFIDPAILAVGKGGMSLGLTNSGLGLKSTLPSQISSSHIDPKPHLLMRQSLPYRNLGLPDSLGDRFFPLGDAYIPSRSGQNHSIFSPIAQMSLQQLNNTALMNKQWDGRK